MERIGSSAISSLARGAGSKQGLVGSVIENRARPAEPPGDSFILPMHRLKVNKRETQEARGHQDHERRVQEKELPDRRAIEVPDVQQDDRTGSICPPSGLSASARLLDREDRAASREAST